MVLKEYETNWLMTDGQKNATLTHPYRKGKWYSKFSRILPNGLGEDDGHSNITSLGDFHRDLGAIRLRLGAS